MSEHPWWRPWWRRSGFPSLWAALWYDAGYWLEAGRKEAAS